MSNDSLILPEAAKLAIYNALRLRMGRGRKCSVQDVHEGTGIPSRNLYAYIALNPEERRTPSGDTLLILCQFFGTLFTNKVWGAIGQGCHDLDPQPGDPGYVIAKLMAGVAKFAELGADGDWSRPDLSALETVADVIIALVTPFSTKGR